MILAVILITMVVVARRAYRLHLGRGCATGLLICMNFPKILKDGIIIIIPVMELTILFVLHWNLAMTVTAVPVTLVAEGQFAITTSHRRKMKGLTLIELLVSAAIMSLVAGISFAGYRLFYQQRAVNLAANSLYSQLALLRSQARNGVKDRQNCQTLLRYEVWWSPADYSLRARQVCDNWQQPWQTYNGDWQKKKVAINLVDGDDNNHFNWLPLSGALSGVSSNPAFFQIRTISRCRQISMYRNGTISLNSCQ